MIFFLMFLCGIILIFEYKLRSPFFLFILISSSVYFLSLANFWNRYPSWVNEEILYLGIVFYSIYLISRFFLSIIFNNSIMNYESKLIEVNRFLMIKRSLVVLAALSLLLSLVQFDFNIFKAINSNWGDNRAGGGVSSLISLYLYYSSSSILLIALLLKDRFVILFSLFVSLLLVLIFKSRGYLVSLFLPIFLYYILYTKISIKRGFILSVFILLLVFLYLFTRYLRLIDGIQNFDYKVFSIMDVLGDDSSEFDLLGALYQIIYYNEYNYVISESFSTIKRIFFIWVPDIFYEKPKDISLAVWDYYIGVLGVGGSYHPTVIGEAYLNHRTYGIFIYPFFIALIFSLIDKLMKIDKILLIFLLGPLCFFMTALARGASYNAFVVLVFSVLCFYIINKVLRRKWMY